MGTEGPPKRPASNPIFTIGHSTRSTEEFVALFAARPRSGWSSMCGPFRARERTRSSTATLSPHRSLECQIAYAHSPSLGGLARAATLACRLRPTRSGRTWSFHNYADYALSVV